MATGWQSRRSGRLELVNDVELITLQDVLWRRCLTEVQRPAEKSSKRQLDIVERLIPNFGAMLADVAALPDVAGVEHGHYRLALDKHPRVGELPIAFLLQAAKARFRPVSPTLTGIAWRAERL